MVYRNTFGHVSLRTILSVRAEFNVNRGGGNVLNPDLNRSGPPLLWMSYEAISAGLSMKLSNVEWKWEQLGKVNESLKGVWKLFEFIPFKHLTYKDSVSTTSR